MARGETSDSNPPRREIRLIEEEGGQWSALDEGAGVASHGETRAEALVNLDEAVALHTGEAGEAVSDADIREFGLDPESVPDVPLKPDVPWFSE